MTDAFDSASIDPDVHRQYSDATAFSMRFRMWRTFGRGMGYMDSELLAGNGVDTCCEVGCTAGWEHDRKPQSLSIRAAASTITLLKVGLHENILDRTQQQSMTTKRTFGRCGLSVVLVITFSLASVYTLACPILCSRRHCMGQSDASSALRMPPSHECCPAHSNRKNDTPCGAPAKGCIVHAQGAAFLIPAGALIPQFHSTSFLVPGVPASLLAFSVRLLRNSSLSPSPPGFPSGRSICQNECFLRI